MPHRLNDERAKIQFVTNAAMPAQIHRAARQLGLVSATGRPSNTQYIQRAICRALSRDLGLDYEDLIDALPEAKGPAAGQPFHQRNEST